MKVAYLVSRYPAVSHTFILRGVLALRALGVEVGTFSVRRPSDADCLGEDARREKDQTRWLVPARLGDVLGALFWALSTRPGPSLKSFGRAVFHRGIGLRAMLKWLFYWAEALILARWLVNERFDRLHCHFGNSGASTGMLAAQVSGVPFSVTVHGSELLEADKHRLLQKVEQSTFVACVSHYGRSQLMLKCPPAHWEKLKIVRCGPPAELKPVKRQRTERIHLLCVGRLSAEKGHLILFDALRQLRDRGVGVHCTLVGDGPLRGALETRASSLQLNGELTMTGALPPTHVAGLYPQADVVVLPSFSEGVPVVLMEAMACGRPVVATRVGGIAELVQHERSGLLVAPGDAGELADAIQRLAANHETAEEMGAEGARFVREAFDIDTSAAQLRDLFGAS